MLESKNRISRIALLHAVAFGVPLLAGCELRVPGDDSDYEYDYGDGYRGDPSRISGGTNPDPLASPRYDFELPQAERSPPAALEPRPEQSYDGPGISTYLGLIALDPRSLGGPHAANADPDAAWSFSLVLSVAPVAPLLQRHGRAGLHGALARCLAGSEGGGHGTGSGQCAAGVAQCAAEALAGQRRGHQGVDDLRHC